MSTDYDSPWKEALDAYFEPFVALLFPEVHRQIDWSRGHESLDKEFQQCVTGDSSHDGLSSGVVIPSCDRLRGERPQFPPLFEAAEAVGS